MRLSQQQITAYLSLNAAHEIRKFDRGLNKDAQTLYTGQLTFKSAKISENIVQALTSRSRISDTKFQK